MREPPRVLVFAGTTEGREFCRRALGAGFLVTASVATEYGREAAAEGIPAGDGRFSVLARRLRAEEMAELVAGFDAVVDATHPYAAEVTRNIRGACGSRGVRLFRLRRRVEEPGGDCLTFGSMEDICAFIAREDGRLVGAGSPLPRVFVSTGSKELLPFTRLADFSSRVSVRVIPSAEAIRACEALGFPKRSIIAMQGPFSAALNEAMFRERGSTVLVTKLSGRNGGFREKIVAAKRCGMCVLALRPPEEEGEAFGMNEILSALG